MLPYYWKFVGLMLTLAGILLGILYLWFDFRFTLPVFAVYSSFIETKMFVLFYTNFADELILLLLICGLGIIIFSKEKLETENLDAIRLKSLAKALVLNTFILLVSVLFVYGTGFIGVLVLNLYSLSVFYLCIFYYFKKKQLSKLKIPPLHNN